MNAMPNLDTDPAQIEDALKVLGADYLHLASDVEAAFSTTQKNNVPYVYIPNADIVRVVDSLDNALIQKGMRRSQVPIGAWRSGRINESFTSRGLEASDESAFGCGGIPTVRRAILGPDLNYPLLHFLGLPFDRWALHNQSHQHQSAADYQLNELARLKSEYQNNNPEGHLGAINAASVVFMSLVEVMAGRPLPLLRSTMRDPTIGRIALTPRKMKYPIASVGVNGSTYFNLSNSAATGMPTVGLGISVNC